MIKIGDYTLYKILGKGSFGEVYLTTKGNNPEIMATKKLDKKQTDRPSIKKYFDNEISIMKELNHPNIVRFYDMITSYSHYYVIMEYCNGGGLSNCLQKYKKLYHRPFTQEIVQYLMRQIIEGLKYIHSHKIIHRDIKLDNILATFSNENDKNNLNMLSAKVKIIDFGLATRLGPENLTFTALGSPINMDPIILKKYNKAGGYEKLQGYNEKADIWSLGTVCYEMLTGEAIFKVKDMKDLMKKVEKGIYTIPMNINLSKEAVSFLNSMLQYDGDDRLSAEELAKHDFIVKNVREFSKVDLNVISDKIDQNGLNINVKANQTIWNVFNNEDNAKGENPPINQNQENNQKKASKNISPEGKYISSNNIYGFNNDLNNNNYYNNKNIQNQQKYFEHRRGSEWHNPSNNYIKIPNYVNGPFDHHHRLTEGFVSPKKFSDKRLEYEKRKEYEKKERHNVKNENFINILDKKDSENKEKDNKLKIYINGLLEEYKAAKDYFSKHELKIQEEDANQKYNQIQKVIKQIDKGFSINSNSLPMPITPEYIYGCSNKERENKFSEIIAKYKDDKDDLETKIKTAILKLKQLDSENYTKAKNAMMPKLESEKKKLDKLKKIIEGFENKLKDKWVPPPKIEKETDKYQIEKVSNNEEDYKLKLHIGKTDYQKDNLILIVSLTNNTDKTLSKEVKLKRTGDYDEDIEWMLNDKEWNNIDKFVLLVEYGLGNMDNERAITLNISKIKEINDLLFECPIDLFPEKLVVKICINIKAEITGGKKNNDSGKKDFNIKKIYPAFEGKSPDTKNIPSFLIF